MMTLFLMLTKQTRCALGIAVILSMTFTLEVFAQTDRKKAEVRQAVSTVQLTSTKAKPMPANTSLKNICDPARVTTRQRGNVLTINCKPSTPYASARLKAKPGVQRSDINCKYTENDQGGLDIESCTCKADSDSNCTNFITWCAKQGADVGGNNQSATCG